jgi:hypothetical protein
MEGSEVISLGVDFMDLGETYLNGVKDLNDWITGKPGAPDPMMDALNKLHARLNEINDLALAIWVTEREDNLAFLLAHTNSALQTASTFLKSGKPRTDPEWAPKLAIADRDSLVAVQTFTNNLEGGFWLRPDSIKAISWHGDPTNYHSGWMPHMPDRAEKFPFNRVWDPRWALPVVVYTISMRMIIMRIVGVDTNAMRQEVQRYIHFIASVFKKREAGVRSVGKLTDKQVQNIATHGVPVAVADIYGGFYVGGLCDPMSFFIFNAKDIPKPPGFHIGTSGHMDLILDNKDKLTAHWQNHVKIMIGLPELLQFSGRLENIFDNLADDNNNLPGNDKILILRNMGIDFSVSESDLRQWLNNPDFTPYPAIAGALSNLLGNKRLRKPVFIDVIVYNYENTPGVLSPRKPEDVNINILRRAVLDGYNSRYAENVKDFQSLII